MAPLRAALREKLQRVVRGRALDDAETLRRYARDRSIYEIQPLAAVFPGDEEDAARLVEFAGGEGIPLTARGGGSGTAGSALGRGIVMVLPEKGFWSRISGFEPAGSTGRVCAAAGVYHNELQAFLAERGFYLPADVTSAEISRIGGNIATKASGPHALRHGSIERFLEQARFISGRGELIDTADEATIPERFRSALADLERRIRADGAARKILEARRNLKTASGYNLFVFLDESGVGQRIARLLAGSVGTLGVVTRALLRVEAAERERAAALFSFDDLVEAGRAVSVLRRQDVAAIELVSRETLEVIRKRGQVLPPGVDSDAHLLFVETTGPERRATIETLPALLAREGLRMPFAPRIAPSDDDVGKLWNLRRKILQLIEQPKPGFRALAVVNDVGVPPERLAEFIGEAGAIFRKQGLTAPVYGHAGNGNLHLRPLFDLSLPDLRGRIQRLADAVYEAVLRCGGTITAEHGMGRLRAPYLRREWGDALYGYMKEVKNLFDPRGLLNPGVMFSDAPITDDLRPDLIRPEPMTDEHG